MEKEINVVIVIWIIFLLIGYFIFRGLCGPLVPQKEKKEIKKYVENHLTEKYGEYKFTIIRIKYNYDMDRLFDYSKPVGYEVDLKSNTWSKYYIIIKGIKPADYEIEYETWIY